MKRFINSIKPWAKLYSEVGKKFYGSATLAWVLSVLAWCAIIACAIIWIKFGFAKARMFYLLIGFIFWVISAIGVKNYIKRL